MRIQDTMATRDSDESPYESEVYQKSIRAFYPLSQCSFPSDLDATTGAIGQMTYLGELKPIQLDVCLAPGEQTVVSLGVFGKKFCSGGMVQISYGHVASSSDSLFCTRELSIPFLLTVVQALSFKNADLLHFAAASASDAISSPSVMAVTERSLSVEEIMMNPRLSTTIETADSESNTFLMTFDFHNAWDEPFKVTFEIYNGNSRLLTTDQDTLTPTSSSTTLLHAGVTKRIILPIARFFLPKSTIQRAVPTPSGKQFVVSKNLRAVPEGLRRALFWYKEHLIGGLETRGRLSNGRAGIACFREFELLPRFIPIMTSDSIQILGSFVEDENRSHLSESPVRVIFRCCSVTHTTSDIITPSTDQVLFIGSSNLLLETIPPKGTASVDTQVLFSGTGHFKIIAHAERIYEKKVAKVHSKYEAPEVDLEEVETVHWLKAGIFMNVVE
ncbi:hypothetical protein HDU91_002648 [Kappamyces sp. JEL0680]|nr:hypothetical protein HDU91_002648 [Kappamyces sp. JEL0680]